MDTYIGITYLKPPKVDYYMKEFSFGKWIKNPHWKNNPSNHTVVHLWNNHVSLFFEIPGM